MQTVKIINKIWNNWTAIAERVGEHPIAVTLCAPMSSAHEMSHYWMAKVLGVPVEWYSRKLVVVQLGTPWKTALIALSPLAIGAILLVFFAWGWTDLAKTFAQYLFALSGLFFSFSWLVSCMSDVKYTWILIKTGEWSNRVIAD